MGEIRVVFKKLDTKTAKVVAIGTVSWDGKKLKLSGDKKRVREYVSEPIPIERPPVSIKDNPAKYLRLCNKMWRGTYFYALLEEDSLDDGDGEDDGEDDGDGEDDDDRGASLATAVRFRLNPRLNALLKRALKGHSVWARRVRNQLGVIFRSGKGQPQQLREVRALLERERPMLERILSNQKIAAIVVGGESVAAALPSVPGQPPHPPEPPAPPGQPPAGPDPWVGLPIIEEAAKSLKERKLLTRDEYDRLTDSAKSEAFTVAGVAAEEILEKVRDAIAASVEEGLTRKQFAQRVMDTAGSGTFISESHMENVFRTNVQVDYSDGMDRVLEKPLASDAFPYEAYYATHDDVMALSVHPANQLNAVAGPGVPVLATFEPQKGPVPIGCALHPWMRAYVYVFPHPWFAVTDAQGRFALKDVPAGKHALQFAHPDTNLRECQVVAVKAGQTARANLDWQRASR